MKLCPQCDFIYEDDQSFCDMDGKELVHGSSQIVDDATVASPVNPELLAEPRSRGFAAAVVVVVVLTALVVVLYLVRARQAQSGAATETSTQMPDRSAGQSPAQSASQNTEAIPSGSDLASTETPVANSEQSPDSSSPIDPAATSQSSTSKTALAHTRLAASPVSARAATGNSRGSVIVRLNNGAAIRADEAWEKKEGVWYRQAGMVTFLKRSSVKSIERIAPPAPPSKPAANSSGEKTRKNTAPQNQLRLAQLEPAETKKPSRFSSFLKKTGRVLKKPFKL